MKTKQVIVVNKSLNMPPGKLAAQVAHASMGAILDCCTYTHQVDAFSELSRSFCLNDSGKDWIEGLCTKIIVYVKSEEKLVKIYEKAKEQGIPCALITDSGLTFFDKPTITCVGIGPAWSHEFIGITDKLQLLE